MTNIVRIPDRQTATRISSLLQRSVRSTESREKITWTQVIFSAEDKILEENPEGCHKSPIDIWKQYPNQSVRIAGRQDRTKTGLPAHGLTPDERELAKLHLQPARAETILAHLMKMAMHIPIKGAGKDGDSDQSAFLLEDFTSRLLNEKVTELDLFNGIERIVEDDKHDFFPTYAKLKRAIFGKRKGDDDDR